MIMLDWSEASIELKRLALVRDDLLTKQKYKETMAIQDEIVKVNQLLRDWTVCKL